MATIAKKPIFARMTMHGGPPMSLTLKEGASQTFVKGEIVFINASGYVEEIAGDTPSEIYGVAAQDAHNTTAGAAEVSVWLADPGTLFGINVLESTLTDHVLAQTDLGTFAAIQRDTTNSKVYANISTTAGANTRIFIHCVETADSNSAIGDTNGRVLVTFRQTFVQFGTTS